MLSRKRTKKKKRRSTGTAAPPADSITYKVDRGNLDDQFERHAQDLHDTLSAIADAEKAAAIAQRELAIVRARRRRAIRSDSTAKVSERQLDFDTDADDDVNTAHTAVINAEYLVSKLHARKSALYEKGRAMQAMADLLRIGYTMKKSG